MLERGAVSRVQRQSDVDDRNWEGNTKCDLTRIAAKIGGSFLGAHECLRCQGDLLSILSELALGRVEFSRSCVVSCR